VRIPCVFGIVIGPMHACARTRRRACRGHASSSPLLSTVTITSALPRSPMAMAMPTASDFHKVYKAQVAAGFDHPCACGNQGCLAVRSASGPAGTHAAPVVKDVWGESDMVCGKMTTAREMVSVGGQQLVELGYEESVATEIQGFEDARAGTRGWKGLWICLAHYTRACIASLGTKDFELKGANRAMKRKNYPDMPSNRASPG
jgi:hypothetical protein